MPRLQVQAALFEVLSACTQVLALCTGSVAHDITVADTTSSALQVLPGVWFGAGSPQLIQHNTHPPLLHRLEHCLVCRVQPPSVSSHTGNCHGSICPGCWCVWVCFPFWGQQLFHSQCKQPDDLWLHEHNLSERQDLPTEYWRSDPQLLLPDWVLRWTWFGQQPLTTFEEKGVGADTQGQCKWTYDPRDQNERFCQLAYAYALILGLTCCCTESPFSASCFLFDWTELETCVESGFLRSDLTKCYMLLLCTIHWNMSKKYL